MSVEKDIRFELLARLCPNSTGKLHSLTVDDSEVGTVEEMDVYLSMLVSLPLS